MVHGSDAREPGKQKARLRGYSETTLAPWEPWAFQLAARHLIGPRPNDDKAP
jgi:hypothetical protein